MCKCCDDNNPGCNCMHHKKGLWLGLLLIVLGVVWYLTSYDYISGDVWKWLLPLVVVLLGLKHVVMGMMKEGEGMKGMCPSCKKGMCKMHGTGMDKEKEGEGRDPKDKSSE